MSDHCMGRPRQNLEGRVLEGEEGATRKRALEIYKEIHSTFWLNMNLHRVKPNKAGQEQPPGEEHFPGSFKPKRSQRSYRARYHFHSYKPEWRDFVEYMGDLV